MGTNDSMIPIFEEKTCPSAILDTLQSLLPPCISMSKLLDFGTLAGGSVAYAIEHAKDAKHAKHATEFLEILLGDPSFIVMEYSLINTHLATKQLFSPCDCLSPFCVFCQDPYVFKKECNDVDLFVPIAKARPACDYVIECLTKSRHHPFVVRTKDSALTETEFADVCPEEQKKTIVSVITFCFAFSPYQDSSSKRLRANFPFHFKPLQIVCHKESTHSLLSRFDFDALTMVSNY